MRDPSLLESDSLPKQPRTNDVDVLGQIINALRTLDDRARRRVYQTVGSYFGIAQAASEDIPSSAQPRPSQSSSISQGFPANLGFSADRSLTPKQFISEKQPRTDVDKVACLAYYLTIYRETPHFTTLDISKLNTEAAQRKLSNATYAVNNAAKLGYLVPGQKGTKQISAAGEKYVQALPDYDAARIAMKSARPRWKKRNTTSET
jgi:hypothetical protein